MNTKLSYKDIILFPNYSDIKTRSDCIPGSFVLDSYYDSVAIPSNMRCTISPSLAEECVDNGYFYIMHRFLDYSSIISFIREFNEKKKMVSISVGVNEKDFHLIDIIKRDRLKVDYITIDIAHGHHIKMKQMVNYIKNNINTHIIGGNIGTVQGAEDLRKWGVDIIKAGLSCGKACTTYNKTGVGTPMFSLIREITGKVDIPVIADGQVREVGDVCKALVAGATMVMIGSEFARCSDSPARYTKPTISSNGETTLNKEFYGSASIYNNETLYIEGDLIILPAKEQTYLQFFDEINRGVQSCMSYAGINIVDSLKDVMDYGVKYCN